MADDRAEFKFDGRQWQKLLNKLQQKFGDNEKSKLTLAAIIDAKVVKDYFQHFEKTEGSKGPWKKRKKEVPWNILQNTGNLRMGLQPKQNYRASKDGVEWYNAAKTKGGFPYAKAHDEGMGKLPQRDFMWLSDKAMQDIAKEVAQWLAEDE